MKVTYLVFSWIDFSTVTQEGAHLLFVHLKMTGVLFSSRWSTLNFNFRRQRVQLRSEAIKPS